MFIGDQGPTALEDFLLLYFFVLIPISFLLLILLAVFYAYFRTRNIALAKVFRYIIILIVGLNICGILNLFFLKIWH